MGFRFAPIFAAWHAAGVVCAAGRYWLTGDWPLLAGKRESLPIARPVAAAGSLPPNAYPGELVFEGSRSLVEGQTYAVYGRTFRRTESSRKGRLRSVSKEVARQNFAETRPLSVPSSGTQNMLKLLAGRS